MESGAGVVDPETAAKERRLEQMMLVLPLSEKTRAVVLSQANDETAAAQAAKEFQLGGPAAAKAGVKGGGLGLGGWLRMRRARVGMWWMTSRPRRWRG